MHPYPQRRCFWFLALALCLLSRHNSTAQIQFDVFLGYDGIAREASWMPVVCELKNDGPGFNGVVEIASLNHADGAVVQTPVELPTGTLKRLVIPLFVQSSSYAGWDLRLRDERGKVRAENLSVQARRRLSWRVPLVGAIPRTAGGAPVIREVLNKSSEIQPVSARFQPSIFPDNPLVLAGMSTLYLNSDRLPDLRVTQAAALVAWMRSGGHLVLAVEQPAEVQAAAWLKGLLPCQLGSVVTNSRPWMLQQWVRSAPVLWTRTPAGDQNPYENLAGDNAFDSASLLVTSCKLLDGEVIAGDSQNAFIVSAERGRGRLTVLLFSPEREPVRSWKNLPSLWARLAGVPPEWYLSADHQNVGAGWSTDSIIGAMIETTQVQSLPIHWLLLLLVAYLLVIGPLDQYWLKRLGKPMLTWITFPCYVLFFSLLIYGIGYKLRAGESEWNELHLVDVLTPGPKAELRGTTFLSAYSPANETYLLNGTQPFGTFRGEYSGYAAQPLQDEVKVLQVGDSFKAQVFVPVWASRLFANDWYGPGESPVRITVNRADNGWLVQAENLTQRTLKNVYFAVEGRIANLPDLGPKQTQNIRVTREGSASDSINATPIEEFIQRYRPQFQTAIQLRRRSFGSSNGNRITDVANSAVAASFLSAWQTGPDQFGGFIVQPGMDLHSAITSRRGVLLAWDPGFSPVQRLYRFSPKRSDQSTLWRIAAPVQ